MWSCPSGSRRGFQDFWTIVTWWWYGCQPYAPAAFILQEIPLLLIYIRSWVDSKAILLPAELSEWKNPNHPIENRTRGLSTCSSVPQQTALQRAGGVPLRGGGMGCGTSIVFIFPNASINRCSKIWVTSETYSVIGMNKIEIAIAITNRSD